MAKSMELKYKEAEAKKDELKASSQKISDLIVKQDKLLGNLVDESIWKGPSRNAVLNKKVEIKEGTKNLNELFNSYFTYMQNVINSYKELDKKLSSEQEKYLNK